MGSDFCWGISSEVEKPGMKKAKGPQMLSQMQKTLYPVSFLYVVPLTSGGYPGKNIERFMSCHVIRTWNPNDPCILIGTRLCLEGVTFKNIEVVGALGTEKMPTICSFAYS